MVFNLVGVGGPGVGSHPWSASAPSDSPPARHLTISDPLLSKLSTLAAGLHREVILCLTGTSFGERATVRDFDMPVPSRSTQSGAAAESCPQGSLALWHNHPLVPVLGAETEPGIRTARPNLSPNPRDLCTLSSKDMETARRDRPPFMAVSVDESTWCWWSLDQIEAAQSLGSPVLTSLPGQRSWD